MASGKLVDHIWGLAVFISTVFPVRISNLNLTYIDSVCKGLNCLRTCFETHKQKTHKKPPKPKSHEPLESLVASSLGALRVEKLNQKSSYEREKASFQNLTKQEEFGIPKWNDMKGMKFSRSRNFFFFPSRMRRLPFLQFLSSASKPTCFCY